MKKFLFVLFMFMLLFSLIGCGNNIKKFETDEKKIFDSLVKEYPQSDKFRVILTKPFRDKVIVIVSYDVGNGHFVDYRLIKEKNNKVVILGGGGGIAQTDVKKPLTFSSGGSISNDEIPYYVTYGEIFDDKIKKIRIEYSNGTKATEEIENAGYLIICEEKVDGVKKIEALDETSKVIYSIP